MLFFEESTLVAAIKIGMSDFQLVVVCLNSEGGG
jgi:hypothetical protein